MMLKKNILFLLLTLFVSGEVFSQTNRKPSSKKKGKERTSQYTSDKTTDDRFNKARIDTEDGSLFIGEYINETEQQIKIKLLTEDTISINKDQVKKARTPENSIVLNKGRFHRTKGLYLHYNLGFNAGADGNGGALGDIGLGYRINKNWEVQTGIGFLGTSFITPFARWSEYKTFFPAYVGASYNITHGSTRLVAFGRAGYSFQPITNNFFFSDFTNASGGAYFEPGIGITFSGKRFWRSQISISQIIQYSNLDFETRDIYNNLVVGKGNIWINRIGVRFTTTVF